MSVNKIFLLGNLGRDVDLKYTQGGSAVCNFSVATTEKWTKDGEKHEDTTWHRIVCWGKTAEICAEHLSKGSSVFIEGRLQVNSWEDKHGQKRETVEINASSVQFLGGKSEKKQEEAPPLPEDEIEF